MNQEELIKSINLPMEIKKRMMKLSTKDQVKKSLKSLDKSYMNQMSSYKCNKCRDMMFIIGDSDEAIPCECRQVRIAEDILRKSGISEEFRNKRFSNFKYGVDSQITNAYKEGYLYFKNFKDIKKDRCNSIMFMGQVGSGKTHLSMAIANELMDSGVGVVYMSYREVITSLKQNIMDEVYYHRVMGRYKSASVLLIDDLFKGKVSESDVNIMFELLNFRYFNRLPVIVSCEVDVEGLLRIDEGVGSRLVEMCRCVEIKGRRLNYRLGGV